MKKRILSIVIVLAILLILVGLMIAQAQAIPKVAGNAGYESGGMEFKLTFDFKLLPSKTEAPTYPKIVPYRKSDLIQNFF
jgi:hypothetical protein